MDLQGVLRILKELGMHDENLENKKIDFQNFLNLILYKITEPESEDNIRSAFELFATKENDQLLITKESLTKVFV